MAQLLAFLGEKILDRVLDAAIDDVMEDIFGKPEDPVDLLKKTKATTGYNRQSVEPDRKEHQTIELPCR